MMLYVKYVAAVLPAALLFLYVWKKDKKPEPVSHLVMAVLWGALILIPCGIVEAVMSYVLFGGLGQQPSTYFGAGVMSFFVAALPEEGFKLLALWFVLRKNPFYDEHYDGIVYAVCIGLGFAATENVAYVIGSQEGWLTTSILRALLAVPGHYAFAVLMGYFYSVYHFMNRSPQTAACIFLVPWAAHGIYDTLAFSGPINEMLGTIFFIVLVFFCIIMHRYAQTRIVAQIKKDNNNGVTRV